MGGYATVSWEMPDKDGQIHRREMDKTMKISDLIVIIIIIGIGIGMYYYLYEFIELFFGL